MSPAVVTEYQRVLCDCGRYSADPEVAQSLDWLRRCADEVLYARKDGEGIDEAEAACRDARRVLCDVLAARLAVGAAILGATLRSG